MGRLSFKPAIYPLVAILFLMFGYVSVYAQYYMNVFQNDGQKFHFVVSNIDSIRFTDQAWPAGNDEEEDKYEFVDLGLSVNWATHNVGSLSPEKYGNYYSWGETELKDNYSFSTYRWLNNDVAKAQWGNNWRTPTKEEFEELIRYCTWTWTTQNGVNGYKVTGKKIGYAESSIFLPAAGYCNGSIINNAGSLCSYWSFSNKTGNSNSAWCLDGDSCKVSDRFFGLTVRPVSPSASWRGITITFKKSDISIYVGYSDSLKVIIKSGVDDYSFFSDQIVWTSSDPSIAMVDNLGVVTAIAKGTTTITASYNSFKVECIVSVSPWPYNPTGLEQSHGYVDLGLSVNWATCNVGADKMEGYGDYYAWGETETKTTYNSSTYKYYKNNHLTKYDVESNNYYADNKILLDESDDVAHVKWGGNWRIPTKAEFNELLINCKWTRTTQNGVNGYKVTSKKPGYTDRSIFLPAAGRLSDTNQNFTETEGHYWSSSLSTYGPVRSWGLTIGSDRSINWESRYYGLSVRSVCPSETWEGITSIEIDTSNTSMAIGEGYKISAKIKSGDLDYSCFSDSIKWSSSDESVAKVDSTGVISALSIGTTLITASYNNLNSECLIKVASWPYTPTGTEQSQGYVDLGLSVRWATCNVGAEKEEDFGDYYAWGDIETKSLYNWSDYKYCKGSDTTLTKYNNSNIYGTVDGKIILDESDDVAHVKWGGCWRIPTKEEFDELRINCSWTWITLNGVSGYKVTSNKPGYANRSIFLPAARFAGGSGLFGHYWSSSLSTSIPYYAWQLDFYSGFFSTTSIYRCYGETVRPVCP